MSASTALPVADSPTLRRYVRELARTYPRMLWSALGLHLLAALAALAAPRLLGNLVQAVDEGTTTSHVDRIVLSSRASSSCRPCSPGTRGTSARRWASRCSPGSARTSSATRSPCPSARSSPPAPATC